MGKTNVIDLGAGRPGTLFEIWEFGLMDFRDAAYKASSKKANTPMKPQRLHVIN